MTFNSTRLNYLIKSGSFKFMNDRKDKSHSLEKYMWNGKPYIIELVQVT